MPRLRPPVPVLAPSQTQAGTKNSFPGPPAQSEQLPAVQISSPELGKQVPPPPDVAERDAGQPEADDDFSAGEWMSQRFARGKKPQAGSREPSKISSRIPVTKNRKTSFPRDFAPEVEEDRVDDELIILDSSSSDGGVRRAMPNKRKKLSRAAKTAKVPNPTVPKEPYPDASNFPRPLDCKNSLPDYVELDEAKGRTWKFIAGKDKASRYDNPKKESGGESGSESDKDVQGCAPPPNPNQSDEDGSSSDGGSKASKRSGPNGRPPTRFPTSAPSPKKPTPPPTPAKKQRKPIDLLEYAAKLSVHV